MYNNKFIALALLLFGSTHLYSQTLHLTDALDRSILNYPQIKVKQALVKASEQQTLASKSDHLPDFTLMAQQSFGTINAQNGPMYSYGGLGVASTSMPLAEQNWNAAFGSLYLANINWNIFGFGKVKNQVHITKSQETVANKDLDQEIFNHTIKVAATYLNLLASQRIKYIQQKNFERAIIFKETTASKVLAGLIPEVELSLATAEVSNANSAKIKAYDKELEFSKNLAVLLGDDFKIYQLDSIYNLSAPNIIFNQNKEVNKHPSLQYQQSLIDKSIKEERYLRSHTLPSLSAFGIMQGRGSGFNWNYVQDNSSYSSSYLKGVGINRTNYIVGFTIAWNLTSAYKNTFRLKAQKQHTIAVQNSYNLLNQELDAQIILANKKIQNAQENLAESKIQLEAAQLAFKQQTALYSNGLSTIIDFTQYLYALNRAEIEHEIAQTNIWQALVFKTAAVGDINLLLNSLKTPSN